MIQALCHFLWTKLAEVAAEVWAHLTHSCVWMWWNRYRMYKLFLCLTVLSLVKWKPSVHPKVNILQALDVQQSSCKITVSLFPAYPPARTRTPSPHPSWIPAVACCSPLSHNRLSPISCTNPLLSLHWNPNTCSWFPSHTGRSKPCMGAGLVKSHRVASLAGGIIAWNCDGSPRREHHKVPVQWFYECNSQSLLTSCFF